MQQTLNFDAKLIVYFTYIDYKVKILYKNTFSCCIKFNVGLKTKKYMHACIKNKQYCVIRHNEKLQCICHCELHACMFQKFCISFNRLKSYLSSQGFVLEDRILLLTLKNSTLPMRYCVCCCRLYTKEEWEMNFANPMPFSSSLYFLD